jgi:hypothetical protein
MFGLFNRNKKQKPDWSPFETAKIHEKFESYVSQYFESKGMRHEIVDGIVKIPNEEFGLNNLGLQNIAQYCKNEGEDKFEQHIAGHFETLIRDSKFNQEFESIKKDYNKVKEYIRVRLYHQSYVQQVGMDKIISKPLPGDIMVMMVYDLPDAVRSIPPNESKSWNISMDDLWKEALNNTLSNYPPNIMTKELQGISYKTVEANHFFSPSIIFNIANYPVLVGKHGSLISTPTRHIVIIYPINDANVIQAINTQIQVTHGVCNKGPGSLSQSLIWYDNKELIHQPSKIEDGKLKFTPTEDFVNLINSLVN